MAKEKDRMKVLAKRAVMTMIHEMRSTDLYGMSSKEMDEVLSLLDEIRDIDIHWGK